MARFFLTRARAGVGSAVMNKPLNTKQAAKLIADARKDGWTRSVDSTVGRFNGGRPYCVMVVLQREVVSGGLYDSAQIIISFRQVKIGRGYKQTYWAVSVTSSTSYNHKSQAGAWHARYAMNWLNQEQARKLSRQ